jgi:hypothetical protein
MPSNPDEVEKLADALYERCQERSEWVRRPPTQAELRTLARDAADVGARTALEEARILARLRKYAPTTIAILEAASLTTDEETTSVPR